MGVWLRRKVLTCEEKIREAEGTLQSCELSEEVLQREWRAQIEAQTRPLPRKSSNARP